LKIISLFSEINNHLIIKDLAEPSRRLADNLNRQEGRKKGDGDEPTEKAGENDEKLIDIEQKDAVLLDLNETTDTRSREEREAEEESQRTAEDEVNELIDLMTLTETSILNEQLKELEKLEQEKRQRNSHSNKVQDASAFLLNKTPFDFINSFASKPAQPTDLINPNLFDTTSSMASASGAGGAFKSLTALMSKASEDFEKEWQAAFGSATSSSSKQDDTQSNYASVSESPKGMKSDNSSFFSSPSHDSLFTAQLMNKNPDLFDASSLKLFASSSASVDQAKANSQPAKTDHNDKQAKV
jgi:hypothetical protein